MAYLEQEDGGILKKDISRYKAIGTILIIWGLFILSFALLFFNLI